MERSKKEMEKERKKMESQEQLLIKQTERNKKEMEKDRKKMDRKLQKEKLQSVCFHHNLSFFVLIFEIYALAFCAFHCNSKRNNWHYI